MHINIKEVAQQTGVSIRSLRYYEKKKLLIPDRTENGYRDYSQADIDRIQMIRFYMALRFGTNEIAQFVNHDNKPVDFDEAQCSSEAIAMYESKLEEVRQQMELLKKQEQNLLATLSCWREMQERINQGLPLERKEA
jgi:DNA-binding transcriptional MerR regulator